MSNRDKLTKWDDSIWNKIDQAVHDEAKRTKVAAQFLPPYLTDVSMRTIQSDTVNTVAGSLLTVNETDEIPILEIWSEFALTEAQYQHEDTLMTAVTLAISAVNKLSRAEDLLIFQGKDGLEDDLFQSQTVQLRGATKNAQGKIVSDLNFTGLLPSAPADQIVPVDPTEVATNANQNRYGENTFGAVSKGYSILQKTHYGRDALVLPTNAFADTWAPLKTTLIMPADRIKGLVADRFYSTSTLPNDFIKPIDTPTTPQGLLIALDGNTMDLVMGLDSTTDFMQVTPEGLYRFRVIERFALRLKDPNAVVKLEFQKGNQVKTK